MKKYFDILELNESASIDDLEQAYKELSNAWRPENFQNLPRYRRKAELKLNEINEAYERLKSYLQAKPHLAGHVHQPDSEAAPVKIEPDLDYPQSDPKPGSPSERLSDSEAEPVLDPPAEPPPWEPDYPAEAPDVIHRPHIQKTVQKSLVFGFVAIIAVLGVLLLYRVLDRQPPAEPQKASIEAASKAEPKPTAARPKKEPTPQAKEIAKTETAAQTPQQPALKKPLTKAETRIQQQAPPAAAPAPEKINYQEALSEEILSPYNRDPARIRRIQKSLIANGYDTGPLDGIIGPHTSAALQQFADDHHMRSDTLFAPDLAEAVVLYAEVAAQHTNWHQIIADDDFAAWLNTQTYYRADQIKAFKSSATARQVNDIIDLYKLEHNMRSD